MISEGRANEQSGIWTEKQLGSAYHHVLRIQNRIFIAMQRNNIKQVRNLQKILLHSYDANCIAVFEVTKINAGRMTPGMDEYVALTREERDRCLQWLYTLNLKKYKAPIVRRVYIPKANRKKRPLGIPTIRDRILQKLVLIAMEPEFEARFHPHSTGFRPNRSCHDAIALLTKELRQQIRNHQPFALLDADIHGCFDNISHEFLLARIASLFRPLVYQWLKAPIQTPEGIIYPARGTPQGGIISPLLANITLDGIENLESLNSRYNRPFAVRYADDFVVIAESEKVLKNWNGNLINFLKERGLELNLEKTRIIRGTNAFSINFLGFTLLKRKPGVRFGRILLKPQKEKVQEHYRKIAKKIAWNKQASQDVLIDLLNPVIRGFAQYYQHCPHSEEFPRIDYLLGHKLRRWCRRRHPNKSNAWIYNRYWKGRWEFKCDTLRSLVWHRETLYNHYLPKETNQSPYFVALKAQA